ncbi:MAG: endonuclease/exonuclease/phosphatase family protein [Bacteroidales bacterium]|jgi:endonuclease/exonuclease/phosphatase family metal-dependent hydrolase|nr:endonuclease/exonuclease/phosphatase family protein [Bacteroidales bacterium]MCI1784671.1 endonuclease/exonuclease/phosphatase family protein [Bacteroidales bacterium]
MKRFVYAFLILLLFSTSAGTAGAQRKVSKDSYVIGFYNLENLFDTYHDEGKNDYEFLPDGTNKWTQAKYEKKLHNMATVIRAMADDNHCYHTLLGVSEVENRHVLEDLVNQPEIAGADYQIVHYDGPDRRGVDVALLYKPENFKFEASESIPFTFEGSSIEFSMNKEQQADFRTRDILMVRGLIDGEEFAVFVAHLPSRIGGKGGDLRSRGAEIIYNRAMELEKEYPGIKIVVMGDMNDNPTDESMAVYMHGKEKISEVGPVDFFSPFLSMLKAGYGSLAYRGEWNIYDIILVNDSLAKGKGLDIIKINKKGFYGRVFKKPFMTQQSGPYKGTPFRTFSNGTFIGGYSDHYPTYIVVGK